MAEPSGIVTSATNAACSVQPAVTLGIGATVGGTGVFVAGTGVFEGGGGSVLTRIPLNGNGVSVNATVGEGVGAASQAVSSTANVTTSIHLAT
jgi:hypothetical protein